jgi:hypothetical protein
MPRIDPGCAVALSTERNNATDYFDSSCAVALPRVRNCATDDNDATGKATRTPIKPASIQELRAQLRAQLKRNKGKSEEADIAPELRNFPAIRAWLASIGETDPETISCVIDNCKTDPDALAYFTRRSKGLDA